MEKRFKTMKDRPAAERPYEKCLKEGPKGLTDGELLAVILRTGTKDCPALELAWNILDRHPVYKGLAGLTHLNLEMLRQIPGIGSVKAIESLCVVELSVRLSRASIPMETDFCSPEYIAAYYMEHMRHLEAEKVFLLLLNGRGQLLKEVLLSEGTAGCAYVSVKSIFLEAFRSEAVSIILIHNHPSGCPEPSREDLVFTRQVQEAGKMLGIPLTDHIIVGDRCYLSMREQKMM